jgi:hypothetical protein
VGGPAFPAGESLVTTAQVEHLVASLPRVDSDWVQVVRAGEPVGPARLSAPDGTPSLPVVTAALAQGYTLQLAKVHRRHAAVGRLCREVERAFVAAGVPLGRHIGSHLYLTPPDAVGLAPHYDDHSVFAVQMAGTKVWRLRRPVVSHPVGRHSGPLPDSGEVELEVELTPGRVLHVPRGWVHDATSGPATSLHVTLDIYPLTWLDLATRLLGDAVALREALPVGAWSDGAPAAVGDELRSRVAGAAADLDAADAVTASLRDFLARGAPLPGGGFDAVESLAALNGRTIVRTRPEALATMATSATPALWFVGSEVGGDSETEKALRFVAEAVEFAVDDIPADLDEAGRCALVRELVVQGLLDVVRS